MTRRPVPQKNNDRQSSPAQSKGDEKTTAPYRDDEAGIHNAAARSIIELEIGNASTLDTSTDRLKEWIASIAIVDLEINQRRRKYAAVALAGVLNILFVWIVADSLSPLLSPASREIHLTLTPFTHADVAPSLRVPEPSLTVMEPPAISIQTDAPTSAPAAASASVVLAPRPDPAHPNPLPAIAEIGAGNAAAVAMVLKIMVLPDGSVIDAVVVKSSGQQETDMAAVAFVKSKWRFLPALMGGTAIQYWTTVSLRTG